MGETENLPRITICGVCVCVGGVQRLAVVDVDGAGRNLWTFREENGALRKTYRRIEYSNAVHGILSMI